MLKLDKKLRFQYIYDIHLELVDDYKIPKEYICILAGDIGDPYFYKYHYFFK
jgi:hypothetical protein